MRVAGAIGFCGGFLFAYQNSSRAYCLVNTSPPAQLTAVRFWGWKENAREVAKDKEEMTARVAQGLPVYGDSQLTPYMQGVASRNSTWAALNFAVLPW